MEEFVKPAEASRLLGITRQAVSQRMQTGTIPHVVVDGRKMIAMSWVKKELEKKASK